MFKVRVSKYILSYTIEYSNNPDKDEWIGLMQFNNFAGEQIPYSDKVDDAENKARTLISMVEIQRHIDEQNALEHDYKVRSGSYYPYQHKQIYPPENESQ